MTHMPRVLHQNSLGEKEGQQKRVGVANPGRVCGFSKFLLCVFYIHSDLLFFICGGLLELIYCSAM